MAAKKKAKKAAKARKFKFTNSIAGADFSYSGRQEVTIGEEYTPTTIPAAQAEGWLKSGLIVPVGEEGAETATVAPKKERATKPRAKKRT